MRDTLLDHLRDVCFVIISLLQLAIALASEASLWMWRARIVTLAT